MKKTMPINSDVLKERIIERWQKKWEWSYSICLLRLYEHANINPSSVWKILSKGALSQNVALRLEDVWILVPYK
jgi:hypothetical protein